MSNRKLRTAVELLKDVLIIALICSAVWMLTSGGLMRQFRIGPEDTGRVAATQTHAAVQEEAVLPMRITATLQEGELPARYVAQYDTQAVDELFQQTAGLLMESLSSAEQPQAISRQQWEQALARAPGLSFDFLGEMPLSALTGWLNAELSIPDALVRRVVLTVWDGSAALYYHDLAAGIWCRCVTSVVGTAQLENALSGLSANGAFYAFESEATGSMARETLLVPNPGPQTVYTASTPAESGRAALEGLMEDLGFNLAGCAFYSGAEEEVGRSGSDTLRMSKNGVVEYYTGEDGLPQFPIQSNGGQSAVFDVVDSCSRLLWQAVHNRSGQARTYLSRVEQTQGGWRLEYEYSLNGTPVRMKGGAAAVFEVTGGRITGFTLRLRTYEPGEDQQIILPPVQAAAAMSALDLEGRELQIVYRDRGDEIVLPGWTAAAGKVG